MTIKTKLTSLILLLFLPLSAFAANGTAYTPMENIPGFESEKTDLATYIVTIYKFGIWTIGIAALLMITIGGIMYVTSAGNNSSMGKAKGIIADALIGVVMALASWLILYVINPDLLKVKLPDASMGVSGSAGQLGVGNSDGSTGSNGSNGSNGSGGSASGSASSGGSSSAGSSSSSASSSSSSGTGCSKVVDAAKAMKNANCAYCNANRNPHTPAGCELNSCKGNPAYTDCSNLVSTAYTSSGCSSPGSTTAGMYPNAESIGDKSSLKAGDAIVYRYSDNSGGHVLICEDDGCNTVIAAAGTGKGIREESSSTYLSKSGVKVLRASKYCGNC